MQNSRHDTYIVKTNIISAYTLLNLTHHTPTLITFVKDCFEHDWRYAIDVWKMNEWYMEH